MGSNVFANKYEVACKASGHKVVAEFPDVCLSPPSPPAGPIPVPYPDTSFAKDTKRGSKSVKVKGKETMLKDKSFYKTSPLGNEAATRSFGGNVVSHTITGRTYFVAWSMDVKFEGLNVDRHVDMVTSNHNADVPGGTGPLTVSLAEVASFLEFKPDAKWGHKRGKKRHDCKGKHDWECDKEQCPDCWDPPCEPNAKETQKRYQESQSGSNEEKAQKFKKANQDRIAKGDSGAQVENDVVDKLGEENIERAGYKAHCSKCHMVADLDIVTGDSVIECKKSTKGLYKNQMTERIIPVAQKCFPGKKIKVATTKANLADVQKKISAKEWAGLVDEAIDP